MEKKVEKVWGSEEWIINREYCGKILNLKKGFRCSIHYHKEKDETFFILEGKVLMEINNKKKIMNRGDRVIIERGQKHRFTGIVNSKILEISTRHKDEDSYRDVVSGKISFTDILDGFEKNKILVIGDIILDHYIYGSVSKISPESPVPVVNKNKEIYELGGTGNVASNLASLGAEVYVFGFVGKDQESSIIINLMESKNINYYLDEIELTMKKTRIIGNGQQIARLDYEKISERIFSEETKKILLEKAKEVDIIIISDYAKGSINHNLMEFLQDYKNKIIVDPKPKNKELYKGVLLITPNEKELIEMTDCSDFKKGGEALKEYLDSDVLLTRSEKGIALFSDKITEIPTNVKEVFDVSGAGDSTIATVALAFASGAPFEEAAIIANHAGGISVSKKGTYSVSLQEIKNSIYKKEEKIIDLESLKRIIEDKKRKNKKIVWTNGCFDLLHIGHIKFLKEARNLGDVLIICLNSDESVKKLKGEGRPIQSQFERSEILASLEFIDHVFIFEEENVSNLLKELKPDIYVKGGDFDLENIDKLEREVLESYGGKINFVPIVKGKSSTELIKKIKEESIVGFSN